MDFLKEIAASKEESLPSFSRALKRKGIIAEVKRKSPSVGVIKEFDPLIQAQNYAGAVALSVLTDKEYFGGSVEDLSKVRKGVLQPVLRKDFIVDPTQLMEVKASCVLLIVALLGNDLKRYLDLVHSLGVEALVEVHDEKELSIAIEAGSKIIGINNRDLRTFEVDLNRSKELIKKVPKGVLKVAESGIKTIKDARALFAMGFDALLVGETLVRAHSPQRMIQLMKRRIKICGVTDPDTAYFAANKGADYIGMVFDPRSKRAVDMEMAKKVAEGARLGGALPVAVFVDQNSEEMKALLDSTETTWAQLHGHTACAEHGKLPASITRVFEVRYQPHSLDPERDYLLYDHRTPGSGKAFDWSHFKPDPRFPYFVAGGISINNIKEAVEQLNPDVVDLSSGVEGKDGKDKKLIEELLERC